MTFFSLSQAAKELGIGKGTISKAISSGRLSYTEKTSAGYKIEASELYRVFPKPVRNSSIEQVETTQKYNNETSLLREMLEREREIVKELQERINNSERAREELWLRLEHATTRKKFLGIF